MHWWYEHKFDRQHTPRNTLHAVMCFVVDQVVGSGYSNRVVVSILNFRAYPDLKFNLARLNQGVILVSPMTEISDS